MAHLVPQSLLVPSDYVPVSSKCHCCIWCRNVGLPGLEYCAKCGVSQREGLPDRHEQTMKIMAATVLAKELRYVSTRALYSGKRGRMSAAQTWDTGRLYEAVDKYCKEQHDRATGLRKDGWNRNFHGCAERWNHVGVLRNSMHVEREQPCLHGSGPNAL